MGKRNGASLPVVAATSPVIDLSPQQRLFVNGIMKGLGPEVAARAAGYAKPGTHAARVMKYPKIVAALRYLNKKFEQKADISRKKVLDGFMEAIDLARMAGEPGVMIQGWREIARLCGHYAPEEKKLSISITAKRAIGQMEALSTDDLMKMIESDVQFIDGEAIEVLEGEEILETTH